MEEDSQPSLKSKLLDKTAVQKQLKRLEEIIDQADEIIHFQAAHDPQLLYATDIVENFLRDRKRVCYGGTAINAILPESLKFYDKEKDLPDYDFFTPDPEKDLEILANYLKHAGFTEIIQRVGIHEGTHKLLVNYVAVADITYMDPKLYAIIFDRALKKDGIYYTDPDFLRMNMYLELGRPRGQVTRWDKVYERLLLLNHAFPLKSKVTCKSVPRAPTLARELREKLLNFIIDKNRILLGAEIAALYSFSAHGSKFTPPGINWFFKNGGALIFMSSALLQDSFEIKAMLGEKTKVESVRGLADILPARILIRYEDKVIAMIVEEQACHSYNTIHLQTNKKLLIGSFDTLLTFYLAIHIFTKDHVVFGYSIACLCQKLIELSSELRKREKGFFPPFSITCSGYQKGFPTLLREKVARILKLKEEKSTRRSSKKKSGTRKQIKEMKD
jgi:hypothetical protein